MEVKIRYIQMRELLYQNRRDREQRDEINNDIEMSHEKVQVVGLDIEMYDGQE